MTSPHTTDQWFVRSGGKIKGPFSSAQLEQLQQRGRLHDGHEISSDRSSWRRYSAGMFNAAEPAAPAEEPFYNLEPRREEPQRAAAVEHAWFYAIGQQQQGPVDAARLKQMLASGEISGDTLVWREGLATWTPAHDVAEIAAASTGVATVHHAGGGTGPEATSVGASDRRLPHVILILSFFTFGFYLVWWFFETRHEMNVHGARIPPAWWIFIPFLNFYWWWLWAAGAQQTTGGRLPAIGVFLSMLLALPLNVCTVGMSGGGWACYVQTRLNEAGVLAA